jgi:predicted nuclease of predicted toxin-antitoxin system
MKLLLDQGLPRSTVTHLAAAGIEAEHVGDLGMAAATDQAILDYARKQQAVVVTLDADFHHLLASSRATSPSVIRLRIEGLKGEHVSAILLHAVIAAGAELAAGAVLSVSEHRVRVRSLPIGR